MHQYSFHHKKVSWRLTCLGRKKPQNTKTPAKPNCNKSFWCCSCFWKCHTTHQNGKMVKWEQGRDHCHMWLFQRKLFACPWESTCTEAGHRPTHSVSGKLLYFVESQNGSGWKRHQRSSSSNPPSMKRGIYYIRLLKAPCNLGQKTVRDGKFSASSTSQII